MNRLLPVVTLACACRADPSEWVEVSRDRGRIVVPAEAEGVPLRCFVDTGSNGTFIASELEFYGHTRLDVGGFALRIEPERSDEVDRHLASMTFDGESPDCWLGWDALRGVAFTVDFARGRARIGPSGPEAAVIDDADLAEPIVAPLDEAEVPAVTVLAQDVEATLIADLGADVGMLHPDVVERMAEPPATFPTWMTTAEGRVQVDIGLLDTLEIGGHVQEEVEFVVYDSPTVAALGEGLDGVLGGSTLTRYAVTFDGPEATLTLQAEAE